MKSKPSNKRRSRTVGLMDRVRAFLEPHENEPVDLVRQFEYRWADGSFDYQKYLDEQVKKAKSDVGDVWADEKTLELIADYTKRALGKADLVICHGSKSGMESMHLANSLGCDGIGTDIAPPESAQGVVQWDFHEDKPEWIGRASVIYTNALDHSYDPKKAVDAWAKQLAPDGLIFIEHTMLHAPEGSSKSDPFGAHPLIMPYLVLEWGQGKYCVTDILKPPHKKPHWKTKEETNLDIWIFVIRKTG
ncbi:class I SAM-dependent methyltransferase [Rhodobacterales bacterium]|nr:class I SAM-dependent methyltransferase [Rhodobacterales bacterium]